jgi:chaperonin GroES
MVVDASPCGRRRRAKAALEVQMAKVKPTKSKQKMSKQKMSKQKMRPLRDRIVVKRREQVEQKVGGIIVPDSAREKPQEAEVVAVGPGRLSEAGKVLPLDVEAGDTVLIGKWSGTEVTVDGMEYLILKEDEVLGVLE